MKRLVCTGYGDDGPFGLDVYEVPDDVTWGEIYGQVGSILGEEGIVPQSSITVDVCNDSSADLEERIPTQPLEADTPTGPLERVGD